MILGYKSCLEILCNLQLYDPAPTVPFLFCQIIAIHFVIFITRIKDSRETQQLLQSVDLDWFVSFSRFEHI